MGCLLYYMPYTLHVHVSHSSQRRPERLPRPASRSMCQKHSMSKVNRSMHMGMPIHRLFFNQYSQKEVTWSVMTSPSRLHSERELHGWGCRWSTLNESRTLFFCSDLPCIEGSWSKVFWPHDWLWIRLLLQVRNPCNTDILVNQSSYCWGANNGMPYRDKAY